MLFGFIEATDNLTRRQKIFSAEQEAAIIDTVVAKKMQSDCVKSRQQ